MCLPLLFIVLHALTFEFATSFGRAKDYILAYIPIEELPYLIPQHNFEVAPVPYYNNDIYYNPWIYQGMMMQNARFPYGQTIGPVSFGGPVKAKGGVTITGNFGNQGFGSLTSYSAPPTPFAVTPQIQPTALSFQPQTMPCPPTLPIITSLPAVTVPSTTIIHEFVDTMPATVTVPTLPMPFIVVTTTVPNDVLSNDVPSSVKFSGKVPASGRVKISRHFF